MTSSNATSWTVRSAPNGNAWNCVAWSPELGIFDAASGSGAASNKAMYSSNGTSWTATLAADEFYNNGAFWTAMLWSPEYSQFICVANGSAYGVVKDPVFMTSSNGTSWGVPTNAYKTYNSICWAPEIGVAVCMANDSNPITTISNVSGYLSLSSASIASLNWTACARSSSLEILVALCNSGAFRGAYSLNSNSININRNGNALTRNGMLANIVPTQTVDRIKSNNTIYSKKLTSNTITSYGTNLFNYTNFSGGIYVDSSGNWNLSGNTYFNNSINYVMTRAYKGSNTASAGVVTFQLQQGLGGTVFSSNSVTYLVTMSLQSGDFGLPRGFWSGIIEYSGFAGGRAQAYTVSSSNATFSSVSTGGLLTITVTQ